LLLRAVVPVDAVKPTYADEPMKVKRFTAAFEMSAELGLVAALLRYTLRMPGE
jgi:hypothetical protein